MNHSDEDLLKKPEKNTFILQPPPLREAPFVQKLYTTTVPTLFMPAMLPLGKQPSFQPPLIELRPLSIQTTYSPKVFKEENVVSVDNRAFAQPNVPELSKQNTIAPLHVLYPPGATVQPLNVWKQQQNYPQYKVQVLGTLSSSIHEPLTNNFASKENALQEKKQQIVSLSPIISQQQLNTLNEQKEIKSQILSTENKNLEPIPDSITNNQTSDLHSDFYIKKTSKEIVNTGGKNMIALENKSTLDVKAYAPRIEERPLPRIHILPITLPSTTISTTTTQLIKKTASSNIPITTETDSFNNQEAVNKQQSSTPSTTTQKAIELSLKINNKDEIKSLENVIIQKERQQLDKKSELSNNFKKELEYRTQQQVQLVNIPRKLNLTIENVLNPVILNNSTQASITSESISTVANQPILIEKKEEPKQQNTFKHIEESIQFVSQQPILSQQKINVNTEVKKPISEISRHMLPTELDASVASISVVSNYSDEKPELKLENGGLETLEMGTQFLEGENLHENSTNEIVTAQTGYFVMLFIVAFCTKYIKNLAKIML